MMYGSGKVIFDPDTIRDYFDHGVRLQQIPEGEDY
jgi:hypothetical protein